MRADLDSLLVGLYVLVDDLLPARAAEFEQIVATFDATLIRPDAKAKSRDVGGCDDGPYPLEYLFSGAVGCFAAVFAFYAGEARGGLQPFDVVAETQLDIRGHMTESAPASGFQSVRMDVNVVSEARASEAELQDVLERAVRGCPGLDTLRRLVAVASSLHVAAR